MNILKILMLPLMLTHSTAQRLNIFKQEFKLRIRRQNEVGWTRTLREKGSFIYSPFSFSWMDFPTHTQFLLTTVQLAHYILQDLVQLLFFQFLKYSKHIFAIVLNRSLLKWSVIFLYSLLDYKTEQWRQKSPLVIFKGLWRIVHST